MPADPPFTVYRDQLTSLYQGLALWKPNPPAVGEPPKASYDKVSIGDVGYVREGAFIRMFNVMLPWDHASNRTLGDPVPYESLSCGSFANIVHDPFDKAEHRSRHVSATGNSRGMAQDDAEPATYRCRGRGALLSLPHGGHRKDIIRKKAFEDYIRNHVVSWFTWAQNNQQGVERIEDLILVSGCTLTTSWAAAAFVDSTMKAEISLARGTPGDNNGTTFHWSNIQGPVWHNNSRFNLQNPPTIPDQCVFIRGFRAKRILFWTRPIRAAAEPRPDDPDNRRDDEIQPTEVPGVPKYRDPVIGVLDYIVEKCLKDSISEDTIAIAHDDDLQLIKGVETLTADAIEKFLHEKQMPLLVEDGVRKLQSIPFEASQSHEQFPPSLVEVDGQLEQGAVPQLVSGMRVPSAGVSKGPNPFVRIYGTVKAVKIHKVDIHRGRLYDLARQCNLLLSTVKEYSRRLVEAEASTTEADEIERYIEGILVRISGWARLSDRAAFLKQKQIQIGIEQCYRDLAGCTDRFTVASSMVQNSENEKRRKEQQYYHLQLMDTVAKLREEVRKLHSIPLEASQSHERLLPPHVVKADGQLGQGAVPQVSGPDMVVPSAGVSKEPNLFVRLYDTVKAVKVHKDRLSDLARQCNLLLSTVREYSQQLVGAEASTTEADEIERYIESILVRISGWARLSDRAAFLRQNQIQIGIEQCYRDLTACTDRFIVASSMVQNSENQERRKEQQHNHLQLMDVIVQLREEVRILHTIPLEASQSREHLLPNSESQEQEKERQRNHLQLIDMIAKLREEGERQLRSMPPEVSQSRRQLLPPQVVEVDGQLKQGAVPQVVPSPRSKAADHSGKVSRVSEDAVIEGSQMLFYIGEWTSDGERTALGRLRDQSPDSQKRFKEWIEASLGLRHRNILDFAGHVTINDILYSVNPNPWIENGNIREYLRRNPDASRVRLLSEVASGMEFLHEREIIHGDLRGKNILINRDAKAIVCGFDLFEFSNHLQPAVSCARWLTPEQITSASIAAPTEKADIWSFGLLCFEVFTGKDPYHGHSDFFVPVLLSQGTHPEHPGSTAVGLSPKMWDLMQSCWQIDPAQRPSISEIQLAIRDTPPHRDDLQPPPGNIDIHVPTLFTPATHTSPPNEAGRPTVEISSPLPPLLTWIPPVTHELSKVASTGFLGVVDQQTDAQAPSRRRASDSPSSASRPLPPLPEDPLNPDIPVLFKSALSQSTTREERRPTRPFSAPNSFGSSPLSSELRLVDSSSSTSGTSKLRRLFGKRRSQTAPDTSPGINSNSLLPGMPNSSSSSLHPEAPPAKPPNRTRIMPTKKSSKMPAPQPTLSDSLFTGLHQSRDWEPVSPVVLGLMEMAASDSECLLRRSTDGTVSAANLEGLVFRVITDFEDPSRNDHFRATFLTIYQLFATSERLFDILKRRFESSEFDPVAARSRYPILLFIKSWLKKGFADEDLKCSSMIEELVLPLVDSETISEKMEAQAKEIARLIKDPDCVRLRQPNNCTVLQSKPAERPQRVKPSELAAALTVVEGDRFKCITYWDYVNFTRSRPNVRRIEVFNIVHDLVKVWVQRTVLESDFLEERMKMYEEWIYTAKECRALNNFSSASAIVLALMSPLVTALALTSESKAKPDLYELAKELTPAEGVYQNALQKVATREVIPWLDLHLSSLNSSFAHSNPIIEVDGHPLIDFKHCSEIAEQINTLAQYSPPQTCHTTRPDLLAYVEYGLKCCRGDDVMCDAKERSARLASEERVFYAQRKKMMGLGFSWSPPRRRK